MAEADRVGWSAAYRVALEAVADDAGASDAPTTTVAEALTCASGTRLAFLVVVIERLGQPHGADGVATVADRTGRVTAHLHRRILAGDVSAGGRSGDVRRGTVLVLRDVVVLASPSARCLNVHVDNVVAALPPDARAAPPPSSLGGTAPPQQQLLAPRAPSALNAAAQAEDGRQRQQPEEERPTTAAAQASSSVRDQGTAAAAPRGPDDDDESSGAAPLPEAWVDRWVTLGDVSGVGDWAQRVRSLARHGEAALLEARRALDDATAGAEDDEQRALSVEVCDNALALRRARRDPGSRSRATPRCFCGGGRAASGLCLQCGRAANTRSPPAAAQPSEQQQATSSCSSAAGGSPKLGSLASLGSAENPVTLAKIDAIIDAALVAPPAALPPEVLEYLPFLRDVPDSVRTVVSIANAASKAGDVEGGRRELDELPLETVERLYDDIIARNTRLMRARLAAKKHPLDGHDPKDLAASFQATADEMRRALQAQNDADDDDAPTSVDDFDRLDYDRAKLEDVLTPEFLDELSEWAAEKVARGREVDTELEVEIGRLVTGLATDLGIDVSNDELCARARALEKDLPAAQDRGPPQDRSPPPHASGRAATTTVGELSDNHDDAGS